MGWQELLIILLIIVFIFGATRIKDISKALGESIREFKKGMSEPTKREEEEALIEAARKMGIETEGKTLKQIVDEMAERAMEKGQES